MYASHTRILLVDGSPDARAEILAPLNGRGYRVTQVRTAREGLETIYRTIPDMLLVSRNLPDMDGLHFCSVLKNDVVLRQVPIIMLDPGSMPEGQVSAGEAGADDCLGRPVDLEELDGRIQQIFRLGTLGINYHPVSGLPGYNTVYRRLLDALERGGPLAVCFMDIRGFRRYNRLLGYEKGDQILAATARLISRVLNARQRLVDFFGHLGSDDFVLITEPQAVEDLCTEIVERFQWVFPDLSAPENPDIEELPSVAGRKREFSPLRIHLSIAILTQETGRPVHVADLIDQGKKLLVQAKREGRSRWVKQELRVREEKAFSRADSAPVHGAGRRPFNGCFPERGPDRLLAQIPVFKELVRARALRLYFQPVIYLDSGRAYGFEALLRGPEGSYLESPVVLFNLARKLDMEQELDLVSLEKLRELSGLIPGDMKIFFNVNPESFFNPRFREGCEKASAALLADRMVLEITRKRRIREFPGLRESILHFKKQGFRVAVDDVKAGTLSLRTVLEIMPDYVKTDISVVRGIQADPLKQRVFEQFFAISARQKMTLISEGVETEEERDFLLRHGVKLAQGFLFSQPYPLLPG